MRLFNEFDSWFYRNVVGRTGNWSNYFTGIIRYGRPGRCEWKFTFVRVHQSLKPIEQDFDFKTLGRGGTMPQNIACRLKHLVPMRMLRQSFDFGIPVHRPGPDAVSLDLNRPKPGILSQFPPV